MAASSWRWSVAAVVAAVVVLGSVSEAASKEHAPAPGVDCSSLILNMADCLSFVSNDSTTEKPEGTCCSGLKTVLKTGPECLCEAFKSSAQLGVVLNVTKAMSLPQACKVSAPSATNCALSLSPNGAPVAVSPSSPSATAPEAGAVTASVLAPAPGGPSGSAAAGLSFSVGSIFVGLVVASLSCF